MVVTCRNTYIFYFLLFYMAKNSTFSFCMISRSISALSFSICTLAASASALASAACCSALALLHLLLCWRTFNSSTCFLYRCFSSVMMKQGRVLEPSSISSAVVFSSISGWRLPWLLLALSSSALGKGPILQWKLKYKISGEGILIYKDYFLRCYTYHEFNNSPKHITGHLIAING